jgi:ankyrin repeat protein
MDSVKQPSFFMPIDEVFLKACKNNKSIDYFLNQPHFNVNITEANGYTGLHYICQWGDVSKAEVLLNSGIDINAETVAGQTPLHIAVDNKHLAMVKLLLKRGAMCKVNISGGSPLNYAQSNQLFEIASVLDEQFNLNDAFVSLCRDCKDKDISQEVINYLKQGAYINAADKNFFNYTPLHYAYLYNNHKLIELLFEKEADINAVAIDGTTVLHCAALASDENLIIRLMEKGALYRTDHSGKNPIDYAPENIKHIFKKMHDDQEEMDRFLFQACKKGQPLRRLFGDATKINLNAIDTENQNWTLLHYACEQVCLKNMTWLLMGGAGANPKSKDLRLTPSHILVMRGDIFGLALLKARKADINSADSKKRTPLHYAIAGSQSNIRLMVVRTLLSMGADSNCADESEKRPLDLLQEEYEKNRDLNCLTIIKLLLTANARPSHEAQLAQLLDMVTQHKLPEAIAGNKSSESKKIKKIKKNKQKNKKQKQSSKIKKAIEIVPSKEVTFKAIETPPIVHNIVVAEAELIEKKEVEEKIISSQKIEEPKKEKKSIISKGVEAVHKKAAQVLRPEKTFAAAVASPEKKKTEKDDAQKKSITFRDLQDKQIILYPDAEKLNEKEYSLKDVRYNERAQKKKRNSKDLCHNYPPIIDRLVSSYGIYKELKNGKQLFTMPGERELLGQGLRPGMFEIICDKKTQEIEHSFFKLDEKKKIKEDKK